MYVFLSVPADMRSITFCQFQFNAHQIYQVHIYQAQFHFLPTPSTYLENLLRVIYISSRIVMEEIFLN